MKIEALLILMAGLLLSGCKKKEAPPPEPTSSGNPLTAPVDYLGAVGKAKKTADKTVANAGLQQTINLFPAPPQGMKFDYNPAAGQLKVVPK